jgi:hypothetical protein
LFYRINFWQNFFQESSKSDNNAIFNPLIESLKKAIEEKQKVAMPSDFDLSTLLPGKYLFNNLLFV